MYGLNKKFWNVKRIVKYLILITLLNLTVLLADATYESLESLTEDGKLKLEVNTISRDEVKWKLIMKNASAFNWTLKSAKLGSETFAESLKAGKYIVENRDGLTPKIFTKSNSEKPKGAKAFNEKNKTFEKGDIVNITSFDYYTSSIPNAFTKRINGAWNIHILGQIDETDEWIQIQEYKESFGLNLHINLIIFDGDLLSNFSNHEDKFCKFLDPLSIADIDATSYYRAPEVKNDESQAVLTNFKYNPNERRYYANDINNVSYPIDIVQSSFTGNLQKVTDQTIIDAYKAGQKSVDSSSTQLSSNTQVLNNDNKKNSDENDNNDEKDNKPMENAGIEKTLSNDKTNSIQENVTKEENRVEDDQNSIEKLKKKSSQLLPNEQVIKDGDQKDNKLMTSAGIVIVVVIIILIVGYGYKKCFINKDDDNDFDDLFRNSLYDEENPAPRQSHQKREKKAKQKKQNKKIPDEKSENSEKEISKNKNKKDSAAKEDIPEEEEGEEYEDQENTPEEEGKESKDEIEGAEPEDKEDTPKEEGKESEDEEGEESEDEKTAEDSEDEKIKKSSEQDEKVDSESENEDPSRDSNTESEQAGLKKKRARRRKNPKENVRKSKY